MVPIDSIIVLDVHPGSFGIAPRSTEASLERYPESDEEVEPLSLETPWW